MNHDDLNALLALAGIALIVAQAAISMKYSNSTEQLEAEIWLLLAALGIAVVAYLER